MRDINSFLELAGLSRTEIFHHASGEVVKLEGLWAYLHCHVPGRSSSFLKTDSEGEVSKGPRYRKPGGYYEEEPWEANLSRATWAVVLGQSADEGGRVDYEVRQIHLWGEVDPTPVMDLVCKYLHGEDADVEMLEARAVGKRKVQREWLPARLSPGSEPWFVRLGSKEFPLYFYHGDGKVQAKGEYQYPESGNAVARTFNQMMRRRERAALAVLPEAQRAYARALLDKKSASMWLANAKNVKFFRRGEKLFLAGRDGELREVRRESYYETGPAGIISRHNLFGAVIASAEEMKN